MMISLENIILSGYGNVSNINNESKMYISKALFHSKLDKLFIFKR